MWWCSDAVMWLCSDAVVMWCWWCGAADVVLCVNGGLSSSYYNANLQWKWNPKKSSFFQMQIPARNKVKIEKIKRIWNLIVAEKMFLSSISRPTSVADPDISETGGQKHELGKPPHSGPFFTGRGMGGGGLWPPCVRYWTSMALETVNWTVYTWNYRSISQEWYNYM